MSGGDKGWSSQYALPLVGFLVFAVSIGVNLQMPLYVTYARQDGFGTSAISVVFAIYAGTLVGFLLSLGGLSDRIGRKPAMVAAIIAAGLATLVVYLQPSLPAVGIARFLQGVAVGLATSAGTAYAAELARSADAPQRAARVMTATISGGFGLGALATALAIYLQNDLPPVTYALHAIIVVTALAVVFILPETRTRTSGSWVRKPLFPAGTVIAASAIIPAWTVTGILIAVVPSVMTSTSATSFNWSALALFLINMIGVLFQPLSSKMAPRASVRLGLILLSIGMCLITWGSLSNRPIILLIGAAVAGSAAYGFIFTGGLTAVSMAAGSERARASAGFFLFAYIGFSGPPLLTGIAFDMFGPVATLFGATIIIAVVSAILFVLLRENTHIKSP
jgi:MFS family permease